MSQKNGWIDEKGHVYIRYSNEQLAEDMGKSLSTIKNSMKELTEQGFWVLRSQSIQGFESAEGSVVLSFRNTCHVSKI